jgi:Type II CAAX prenyl endopeptidase Rce1-like
MPRPSAYLKATRHPWACTLFVLPLLVAYEWGVVLAGTEQTESLRNGADVWLRLVLASLGLRHLLWAPLVLIAMLCLWSLRQRAGWPGDCVGLWIGMTVESAVFAVALWAGCCLLLPLLNRAAVYLDSAAQPEPAVQQMLSFLGAGIYEEALFRLLLFSGLRWLLARVELPWPGANVLAAAVSALVFSAAHNIGPYGELFEPMVFAFRTLAGLYFVALYRFRGFGIAVGAHAGYDVLVGILLEL